MRRLEEPKQTDLPVSRHTGDTCMSPLCALFSKSFHSCTSQHLGSKPERSWLAKIKKQECFTYLHDKRVLLHSTESKSTGLKVMLAPAWGWDWFYFLFLGAHSKPVNSVSACPLYNPSAVFPTEDSRVLMLNSWAKHMNVLVLTHCFPSPHVWFSLLYWSCAWRFTSTYLSIYLDDFSSTWLSKDFLKAVNKICCIIQKHYHSKLYIPFQRIWVLKLLKTIAPNNIL